MHLMKCRLMTLLICICGGSGQNKNTCNDVVMYAVGSVGTCRRVGLLNNACLLKILLEIFFTDFFPYAPHIRPINTASITVTLDRILLVC